MEDPDLDSTWEDEDEEEEDGGGPSAGDDDDGEAGALGETEDEEEDEEVRPSARQSRRIESLNWRAVRDTRRYRRHYPDLTEGDSNGDMPNLSFYRNETPFLPNGCLIEDILQNWKNDYDRLEDNHSYIQWLFPLREPGVNWHAKPLTQREIKAFKSSKEAGERFVRAYELMLGFYGIELEDRDTGKVRRAQSYQKRFQNLNRHSHNNLRLTRILKSLGELGLERYQAPLVRFFLEETLVRRELPAVRRSALDYFVFTVRCPRQRRALLRFAWAHFRPRRQFVWAPHHRLRGPRPRASPRPPLPAGPAPAEGEAGPAERPLPEPPLPAGAPGRTCGPGRGEGREGAAAGPPPPGPEPPRRAPPRGTWERGPGARGKRGPSPRAPRRARRGSWSRIGGSRPRGSGPPRAPRRWRRSR